MTAPIRVLVVHNAYQLRGGEDLVVEAECELLRKHGHAVQVYGRHNDELAGMRVDRAVRETFWSTRTRAEAAHLLSEFRPQIMHVHNTFPLISPSIYWAAARANVPVVQTLHNFRLHCPQAMYLRDGRVCEDCVGRLPLPAVMHGCYRDSRTQSAVLTGMLGVHRAIGTWDKKIHRYIALSDFALSKFVAGGLPAHKLVVKPNFVDVPFPAERPRSGFLFVGRLSVEKGIATLAAATALQGDFKVKVAGVGPESDKLAGVPGIELMGALAQPMVHAQMCEALALVLPSICYENFPRTLVEAYGCGLPVIASRIGALAELVHDGVTGLLFTPGDAADLRRTMEWAQQHPSDMAAMGRNARRRFEAAFTPESNYNQLMRIYDQAISETGAQ